MNFYRDGIAALPCQNNMAEASEAERSAVFRVAGFWFT
jgi:hypothetical protein